MNIFTIYNEHSAGSTGFIRAVLHLGTFNLSANEIIRIAAIADNASDFLTIWTNDDFWTDENNVELSL